MNSGKALNNCVNPLEFGADQLATGNDVRFGAKVLIPSNSGLISWRLLAVCQPCALSLNPLEFGADQLAPA